MFSDWNEHLTRKQQYGLLCSKPQLAKLHTHKIKGNTKKKGKELTDFFFSSSSSCSYSRSIQ